MLPNAMRQVFYALLLLPALPATAADEYKLAQLEQAVRTLQGEVRAQAQQLDELRSRVVQADAASSATPASPRVVPGIPDGNSQPARWLNASAWQQLRPGMSELQVIALLGAPTSVRVQGEQRLLFYALEIGNAAFLGGSVTFRERAVSAIQQPTLR